MSFNNYSIIHPFRRALLVFALIFLFPFSSHAGQAGEYTAGILVSRHIKPYMQALDGLRETLRESDEIGFKTYILDQHDLDHPAGLSRELSGQDYDILISIGPEATTLAWTISAKTGCPTVFSMVLNPDALAGEGRDPGCGVSLTIPVEKQLQDIRNALPGVDRIGILFDPEENRAFAIEAARSSVFTNHSTVPLEVSSSRDIPAALEAGWKQIDALWLIPDRTVISQTLVEHIIKEALFHKKPVVGYNRFFYDSGAALAFVLDFGQIGRQSAETAVNLLKGWRCTPVVPGYEVLINRKVMRNLDLGVPEGLPR